MDLNSLREVLKKIKLVFDKNNNEQIILTRNKIICFNQNYLLSIPFNFEFGKNECFFIENEFVEIMLKDKSSEGRFERSLNALKIITDSGFDVLIPTKDLNINLLSVDFEKGFLSIPTPFGFIDKIVSCKPFIQKTTELSQHLFVWGYKDCFFSASMEVIYKNKINQKLDILNNKFSLTGKNIDVLQKLKPCEYKVTDLWVMFKCEFGETLLIRQYNFDCPSKLLEEFDNFKPEFIVKFPFDIVDDISKFLIVNGKNNSHLAISIDRESARMETINTKIKASKTFNVECNFDGDVNFYIDPKILQNSLSISNIMNINKYLNAAMFKNIDECQLIGLGV
jgi:hypothetical protein